MTNSTQFILFSGKVAPIATPVDSSLLCIFDHYSFIFCEPGTGTKLQLSVIYDIPSWQRMKNKLDFPTPFPDQLLYPPTPPPRPFPPVFTPASLLPAQTCENPTARQTQRACWHPATHCRFQAVDIMDSFLFGLNLKYHRENQALYFKNCA